MSRNEYDYIESLRGEVYREEVRLHKEAVEYMQAHIRPYAELPNTPSIRIDDNRGVIGLTNTTDILPSPGL